MGEDFFSPMVGQILGDGQLRAVFMRAYSESWGHASNIEEMHRSDLLFWLINILDVSKTGEINSNIDQIKNPKRKVDKSKLRKYSMGNGDTFARAAGIMPERWTNTVNDDHSMVEDDRFLKMEEKFRSR